MKKLLCMLSLVGTVATSAHAAAGEAAVRDENGFYAGIATGRLDFDFDGQDMRTPSGAIVRGSRLNIDIDSKTPLRLSAGYNWGGWAFEVGYEHMLGSADMEIAGTNLDFDYSNFTLGGVYRSSGQLYWLGKFGVSVPAIESKTPGTRLHLDSSPYAGIGLGYRIRPALSVEFDFTQTNEDTGAFMLGLRARF
jgi:opacity protein-like surface antigen